MSTTIVASVISSPVTSEHLTLEDLVGDLGRVPLSRILARPAPGTATESDLIAVNRGKRRLCELVDGVLVEKPMGARESELALLLARLILNYVIPLKLGSATGPDGAVKLAPGLIRVPDVSLFLRAELPGGRIPNVGVLEAMPVLAIEILSESNTKAEMDRKRAEYFRAGIRAVWLVDPRKRTVVTYDRADAEGRLYSEGTIVENLDFLPGFRLELSELFEFDDSSAEKGQES